MDVNLSEISARFKSLNIFEDRGAGEEACELVFFTKDNDAWVKVLSDILGAPIKPEGKEPTKEDEAITENYGGIFDNQTLFKKDVGESFLLGMLWPWGDKEHTTLKIFLVKR